MKKILCALILVFAMSELKSQVQIQQLVNKLDSFRTKGDRYSYLITAREIVSSALEMGGDTSRYYSVGLRYIGNGFYDYGELDSAMLYYEKSKLILIKNKNNNNVDYSDVLNNIANVYLDLGDTHKAEAFFLEALSVSLRIQAGFKSTSRLYRNLGSFYHRIGDYKNAEKYYFDLLEIIQLTFGDNSIYCVSPLQNIAAVQVRSRKFDEGMVNYHLILKILSLDRNNNHGVKIGEIYLLMAQALYKVGDLTQYQNYISKSEDLLLENCDSRAFELGLLYDAKGNYYYNNRNLDSAELYYQRSKRIYEYHKNYSGLSDVFGNLALIADGRNDYDNAEKYYLKSISLTNPINDQTWTNSYLNLINLYNKFSEFAKAAEMAERAIILANKNFGDSSEVMALIANNLSVSLDGVGEDSLAYEFLKISVGLKARIYGRNSFEYAKGLWHMSLFDVRLNHYFEAEQKLFESLKIYKELNSVTCWYQKFNSYTTLIRLYSNQSKWKEAEKILGRAKQINELKELCPPLEYLDFSCLEMDISYQMGHHEKAYNLLINNFTEFRRLFQIEFQKRSKKQQHELWFSNQATLNLFGWVSIGLAPFYSNTIKVYYEVELLRKYMLTNTEAIKSEYFYEKETNLKLHSLYLDKLKFLKSNNIVSDSVEFYNNMIDSLEKAITRSWDDYQKNNSNWNKKMFDIQIELESDEVVVDFVKNFDLDQKEVYYSAFIYNKSSMTPVFLRLCQVKMADSLIQNLGNENFLQKLSSVYDIIWRPLLQYVEQFKVVYFSPIGELNNLPFRVLVAKINGSAVSYLSDVHDLHNLMSIFSLSDSKYSARICSNKALLVGAVDFNCIDGLEPEITNFYKANQNVLKYQGLPFLEGSSREIDVLDSLLSKWDKKIIKGKYATERRVINYINDVKPNLVHIATHGYCEKNYNDFFDFEVGTTTPTKQSFRFNDDDMARSGIVLSGGNFAWLGLDSIFKLTGFDGLLNSIDVSNLELFNSDLVVLSACNTGLGENYGFEGNFGLKRGLKLAGVKNLIVTQWPIDDEVSILFFRSFYKSLVETSNINKSYNIAMLELRKKFQNLPYLWGAFELVQ
jgi:CHAT domain-containing protein/tetratricopeptide (TPR) repeat protein